MTVQVGPPLCCNALDKLWDMDTIWYWSGLIGHELIHTVPPCKPRMHNMEEVIVYNSKTEIINHSLEVNPEGYAQTKAETLLRNKHLTVQCTHIIIQ
jgi:hypothetical protein